MNDLDMERRLSEAFDAKAEQLVPSRATPPPLDLDRPTGTVSPLHRHRRVWIGTGLIAAAAAVVVGALVAVSGGDLSSRPAPVTPAQQTTAPAPSVSGTPTAPTTPPPSSPSGVGTGSAPAAAATHAVSLDGVTVTVPASWQAAPAASDTLNRCLTVGGVAEQMSDSGYSGNCELRWVVGTVAGDPNPDMPGVFGNSPSGCRFVTVTADEVTVDGQSAEHRVFTSACFQGAREQWTVLTAPVVVFARDLPAAADADTAAADAAVQGARLPPRTGSLRVYEVGYPRAASASSLSVDRITFLAGGGIRDNNPATYPYPLTAAVQVRAPNGTVTVSQLAAMVAGGDYSAAGITGQAYVRVHTDGTTVTGIELEPVS